MITVYNNIFPFDLTSVGGPKDGTLIDCLVQGKCQLLVAYHALVDCPSPEIDIATGALLFNWSMFDHVSPFDSYVIAGQGVSADLWDAYHMNSIDKGADGSYLVSSRRVAILSYL